MPKNLVTLIIDHLLSVLESLGLLNLLTHPPFIVKIICITENKIVSYKVTVPH